MTNNRCGTRRVVCKQPERARIDTMMFRKEGRERESCGWGVTECVTEYVIECVTECVTEFVTDM